MPSIRTSPSGRSKERKQQIPAKTAKTTETVDMYGGVPVVLASREVLHMTYHSIIDVKNPPRWIKTQKVEDFWRLVSMCLVPGSRNRCSVLGARKIRSRPPCPAASCTVGTVQPCQHVQAQSAWSPRRAGAKFLWGGGVTKTIHIQCSRLKTKFDIFLVDSFREWSLFILGSGQYLQVGGGLESNNILRERNSWPTQCMGKKFCSLPNVTW